MKKKILIVTANYYSDISENLLKGAISILNDNKLDYDKVCVPGALEIPLAIKSSLKNKYNGYIALGCIIRGETYHFEIISNECARAINSLSLDFTIPIGFGVITCNNIKEAENRSKKDNKNKGREAAIACVEMLKLLNNE